MWHIWDRHKLTEIPDNMFAFLVTFSLELWASAAEISSSIHKGINLRDNLSFMYKARRAMNNLFYKSAYEKF
jgi:hypothetical protein